MKILRDDKLIKITFDEGKKLLWTEWKKESFNVSLTKAEIKQINQEIADYIIANDADYYLADQRQRGIVYTIDLQEWIAQVLAQACVKANIKRAAIIQPADYIVRLSNEQTINEVDEDVMFDNFKDFDEAWSYLFG